MASIWLRLLKIVINEKEQSEPDRHVSTPSEANTEKHNFSEVEEEGKGNFAINKNIAERQKQWQREIKEGEGAKGSNQNTSTMPMEKDDTLGVP